MKRHRTLMEGFEGDFARPKRGFGFRIAELVVLVVVLLLPILYIAMIAEWDS